MQFKRYAIYYTPPPGPLSTFCTAWLGWDLAAGVEVDHPDMLGLPMPISEITATPRKYGLHATIKPPFRLAEGRTEAELREAFERLIRRTLHPVTGLKLQLTPLGRFLALTAEGNTTQLKELAATTVENLDPFRAPAPQTELDRRRAGGLTPGQDAMLERWGYPYVMDEFRFHITLTSKLPKRMVPQVQTALEEALDGLLGNPLTIDSLSLVGEAEDGRFHLIQRQPLAG